MAFGKQTREWVRKSVVAMVALLSTEFCYGDDDFALDVEDYLSELPVVLTVTRLPQNLLEIPASMTVIDRRMIEATGATELPDILRLAAGIQMAHNGATRTSVTYHGLSDDYARRIQVLVDGRSVYMPTNGGVDWFDVPLVLEDIERIEVIRGPNGVSYGANSFKAVVNIITRHAANSQGTFAKLQGGEGNYQRAVVRQGGRYGDLNYRLTLEHQSDDGFDPVFLKGRPTPYDIRDDKTSDKLVFRGDYRAGINDYLNIGLGFNQGPRGRGYVSTGDPDNWDVNTQPAFDAYNRRNFQQLGWRRILSSSDEFQLRLSHTYSDTQGDFETALLSEILGFDPIVLGLSDQTLSVDERIKEQRYDLEFEHRAKITDRLRAVWGAELRQDEVVSEGYLGQDTPIDNQLYRLFAHTEWLPDDIYRVNIGAMLEQNGITGTTLSPRLAINRTLAAGHAMRVSYTQAYRNPAFLEEYGDFAYHLSSDDSVFVQLWKSDGGLKPEKMTSYELGFMGYLGNERSHYDIKFFKEELRNLITPIDDFGYPQPYPVDQSVAIFRNGDWADIYGYELQLRLQADDDTMVSIGFSHARGDGVVTTEANPDESADAGLYVPQYTASFLLDHYFGSGWRGSMEMYEVNKQKFWFTTHIGVLNLRVSKTFNVAGKEAEFSVAAHNINNSYYDIMDEYVMTPRVYASLAFQF